MNFPLGINIVTPCTFSDSTSEFRLYIVCCSISVEFLIFKGNVWSLDLTFASSKTSNPKLKLIKLRKHSNNMLFDCNAFRCSEIITHAQSLVIIQNMKVESSETPLHFQVSSFCVTSCWDFLAMI